MLSRGRDRVGCGGVAGGSGVCQLAARAEEHKVREELEEGRRRLVDGGPGGSRLRSDPRGGGAGRALGRAPIIHILVRFMDSQPPGGAQDGDAEPAAEALDVVYQA